MLLSSSSALPLPKRAYYVPAPLNIPFTPQKNPYEIDPISPIVWTRLKETRKYAQTHIANERQNKTWEVLLTPKFMPVYKASTNSVTNTGSKGKTR